MTLTADRFAEFFEALYRKPPFPWQRRLASDLATGTWPDCIDLPTASGKTSLIDIAVYTLAAQASRRPADRTIGRRIFFTVNRRVIVDEAHDRAVALATALKGATAGILKEVADALRAIGGSARLPLDVAILRGGVHRDSAWTRSVVQPTIICTTADQLGSRLLFRGYGVSPGMQPIHAAACACDSLVLLDEAHVTKAFSQTLRLLEQYQQHKPGLRFLELTATPSHPPSRRFVLAAEDRKHPVLKARLESSKPATLAQVSNKSLVAELVKRANEAVTDVRKAVGIIVNRVQTARDVYHALHVQHPDAVYLVIGRMRPLDRDDLQATLRALVGPDRPDVLESPVFVIATQCLEVGADYDFDALITECASIDALRQRFGRLNRRGRDISAYACVVTTETTLKDDDPIYGSSLKHTWEWLTHAGRTTFDFGITAFHKLWETLPDQHRVLMTNTTPDAAVLLPAHLDALCQTNPQPVPSPDVSYFIHGPKRDNAEVNVCWRADLGNEPHLWGAIVSMLPPTAPECMTVPLRALRHWMLGTDQATDADVPIQAEDPIRGQPPSKRTVLRWRGPRDAIAIVDPNLVQPGDTVVIAAPDESSGVLGHLPIVAENITYDLAERACAQARRQCVIRLHHSVHPELMAAFAGYLAGHERMGPSEIRRTLGPLANGLWSGPAEVDYPDGSGTVLRFSSVLAPLEDWKAESLVEDDGEDSSSDSTEPLLLAKHVADVMDCLKGHVEQLGLDDMASPLRAAVAFHDAGKADIRFTAMLSGVSPYEVLGRPPLAKSGDRWLSPSERYEKRKLALLPDNFRHEAISLQWVERHFEQLAGDGALDRDLLLHLIASHHGYARPFMPVCDDCPDDPDLLGFTVDGHSLRPEDRQAAIPAHRLDSGVAERFWSLTRKYGWWGLAYLESILRLADQMASSMEQEKANVTGDMR